MLVALVALFVALGGTSYAALTLGKNSVGSKQLKKNAVTTSKIKNRAVTGKKLNLHGVTAPNASELGGVAASGYEGRAMWALVESNGTILAQSGGISVQDHPFPGGYYLAFPSQVAGKAVIATASAWDGTNGELAEGSPCGSSADAIECVHGSNTSSDAFVGTVDAKTEAPENATFYIAVLP
jgi:hypothetical protein